MSSSPDDMVEPDGGETATPSVNEPTQETLLDLVTSPITKAYTKYFGAIYGIVGLGIGVLLFVLDAVGMSPLVVNYPQYSQSAGTMVTQSESAPLISGEYMYPLLMILAVALAIWASVVVARNADLDDRTAVVSAAVATGVGTLLLLLVGGFLSFQQLRLLSFVQSFGGVGAGETLSRYYSIEILNLIVNAAVVGVVVGLVAGAATRLHRTHRPD